MSLFRQKKKGSKCKWDIEYNIKEVFCNFSLIKFIHQDINNVLKIKSVIKPKKLSIQILNQ